MTTNAAKPAAARAPVIQLNEIDPDRKVLITPQDEDRFSLTCSQAIEACRVHIGRKVWFDELDAMLGAVKQWCEAHPAQVFSAYAAPRDGRVVVFIVPVSKTYDLELGGQLTELDLTIAQRYQLVPSEFLQIPGKTTEALESFVDPQVAKFIYGQASQPSGAVAPQP